MKDYKRITMREFAGVTGDNIYNRLAELEDKIEAGTLGDVTAYKTEAEYWEKLCKLECDEHDTKTKAAAKYMRRLMQERDEYKHRAEVAEKDLERHKRALSCACKASAAVLTKELVKARVDCFLRKAEREIEEEKDG